MVGLAVHWGSLLLPAARPSAGALALQLRCVRQVGAAMRSQRPVVRMVVLWGLLLAQVAEPGAQAFPLQLRCICPVCVAVVLALRAAVHMAVLWLRLLQMREVGWVGQLWLLAQVAEPSAQALPLQLGSVGPSLVAAQRPVVRLVLPWSMLLPQVAEPWPQALLQLSRVCPVGARAVRAQRPPVRVAVVLRRLLAQVAGAVPQALQLQLGSS